jgi:hypothetical protein
VFKVEHLPSWTAEAVMPPSNNDLGPPERERAAPHHQDDPNQRLDSHTPAPDSHSVTDAGERAGYDRLEANALRFAASRRMAPIPSCGCGRCVRDPDYDRHRCGDEISDHMAEAAVDAIVTLDQLGTPRLLDERTCRAMARVGRRDLAVAVRRRTTGAI